jgi:hypothetical protein
MLSTHVSPAVVGWGGEFRETEKSVWEEIDVAMVMLAGGLAYGRAGLTGGDAEHGDDGERRGTRIQECLSTSPPPPYGQ